MSGELLWQTDTECRCNSLGELGVRKTVFNEHADPVFFEIREKGFDEITEYEYREIR